MTTSITEWLQGIEMGDIGAKAANLELLRRWGFPVPNWFVIPASVCERHIDPRFRHTDPASLRKHILTIQPDAQLVQLLSRFTETLAVNDRRVAVRSSSIGEDGAMHSFAGQLESYLFVTKEEVFPAVRKVWASAFGDRAIAYRRERGILTDAVRVGVIVQEMIDADVSGVSFGLDPVTGDRSTIVISAVYGLGEGLVSGELDADRYTVRADGPDGSAIEKHRLILLT